ncbi:MAG: hypothetical protein L0I76_01795 [Pseudonocardia sp.]|nr:hypothetical protein [Pseudonocardia sp.]
MARGRARARRRVCDGDFGPHPGWRQFIEPTHRVLTAQPEALRYLERRVDDEEWRSDKRRSWSLILRQLVLHMDWETGLITGLTAERLGDAGRRATRTVSRVLAWAREAGVLVVVECGASAEFLGTETGRTPTYALVTTETDPAATRPSTPVDESGDLPKSLVGIKPLQGDTRPATPETRSWPAFAVPDSPSTRNSATLTLLKRLGLGGRRNGKIAIWRVRALLKPWWDEGACIAALLHAAEFHPDRPGVSRGDVARGASDPIGVLGSRLRPWRGRLDRLPAHVTGHRMQITSPPPPIDPRAERAVPAVRADAQAALQGHLAELRERRQLRAARSGEFGVGLPVPVRTGAPGARSRRR